MRVLVCGGRNYNNRSELFETMDNIVIDKGLIDLLIHGAARGADKLADEWACAHNIVTIAVPAEWDKYGKIAGPIRNKKMLQEYKPDLVVAFPGGIGTKNMIKLARNAGIEVIRVIK